MTTCRLWHLAQTALSAWSSRARRGFGGAFSAPPPALNKVATSSTPPMHAGNIGFETSAMVEGLICGSCIYGGHTRQGDGCAAWHRRDMRTNAQLLRGLVVAETIGELVRDPLGVAIVEGHLEQLFAIHSVSIFVLHLADDLVRTHLNDVAR